MFNNKFGLKIVVYAFICISIFIAGCIVGFFSNSGIKWTLGFYEKVRNEFGTINRNEEYVIDDIPLNYSLHLYIIEENDVKTIRAGSIFD